MINRERQVKRITKKSAKVCDLLYQRLCKGEYAQKKIGRRTAINMKFVVVAFIAFAKSGKCPQCTLAKHINTHKHTYRIMQPQPVAAEMESCPQHSAPEP